MNVLQYLALQSETFVIILQKIHCTNAENLVLPSYQLAGSSLSRNHDLATFVHKRLRYTLLDQLPPTSEIEWLCVNVDGYKIVNVYKPPPTRLQFLYIRCFLTPVFRPAISTVATLIEVTIITGRTVSAWLAGQALIILSPLIQYQGPHRFLLRLLEHWHQSGSSFC